MPRREGQLNAEDFFDNTGGLNTAFSPFVIPHNQAADGQNYDYTSQGAIVKRFGHTKLNSVADTQLRSLGIGQWNTAGDTRAVIRVAGRKVQKFDTSAFTFTNLSTDVASPTTDIFPSAQTTPVVFAQFNNSNANTLWMAGAGSQSLFGVYSTTKVTQNGVPAPTTSSFTATPAAGGTLPDGTYFYTLVFHKASTGVISNGGGEASATAGGGNNTIDLAWTLTNNDTTRYDQIWIYRSATDGISGFITGDLIAQLASTATTYVDTGTSIISATLVPRPGNTLDNSQLPSGTVTGCVVFKRHLITAIGTTVYISDTNKPESWPALSFIDIPSGGSITGFGIVSLANRGSTTIDELLVIFKQRECWVITGNDETDITLKQIDSSGCANQSLAVSSNGWLFWCNYRGFMAWNGTGKPGYVSRFIEDKFKHGGDIDKSKLNIGFGIYSQRRNEIAWYLSTTSGGENKSVFKLDLRLTLGTVDESIGYAVIPGVFTPDLLASSMYAGCSFFIATTSDEESIYLGDGAGFVYDAYTSLLEAGTGFTFKYSTPFLSVGDPGSAHQYHKVVAWVLDTGSWDLELDYWTQFGFIDSDMSTVTRNITQFTASVGLVWDVGKWDEASWDTFTGKIVPVVFNLHSSNKNNTQGDSIKLRFVEADTSIGNQVTLYGFTLYYTDLPLRK